MAKNQTYYWTIIFDDGDDEPKTGWTNVKGRSPQEALRSVVPFRKRTAIKKKPLKGTENGWTLIAVTASGVEEIYKAFRLRKA